MVVKRSDGVRGPGGNVKISSASGAKIKPKISGRPKAVASVPKGGRETLTGPEFRALGRAFDTLGKEICGEEYKTNPELLAELGLNASSVKKAVEKASSQGLPKEATNMVLSLLG